MKPRRYWKGDKKHKYCRVTGKGMSGVYFLFDKKEIVYIGQSVGIYFRLLYHKNKIWQRFRIIESSDRNQMRKWETILLNKYIPKYNIQIPKLIKPDWYIERMEMIRFFREQEKVA